MFLWHIWQYQLIRFIVVTVSIILLNHQVLILITMKSNFNYSHLHYIIIISYIFFFLKCALGLAFKITFSNLPDVAGAEGQEQISRPCGAL